MHDDERKEFLVRAYGDTLTEIGWKTTHFEMVNIQNQSSYYLFFATRSQRGMEVMKNAMRQVSPDGLFRYSDRTVPNQARLFGAGMDEEYATELADRLSQEYCGQEVAKKVIVSDVVAWHPRWVDKDLTAALRRLEDADPPLITDVRKSDGTRRRLHSFPDGCLIQFAACQ
jgi:hypothetical protein